MSATDEQLQFVHSGGMDHVTYILIMFRYVGPRLTSSPLSDFFLLQTVGRDNKNT
jgi:hypothetical protein